MCTPPPTDSWTGNARGRRRQALPPIHPPGPGSFRFEAAEPLSYFWLVSSTVARSAAVRTHSVPSFFVPTRLHAHAHVPNSFKTLGSDCSSSTVVHEAPFHTGPALMQVIAWMANQSLKWDAMTALTGMHELTDVSSAFTALEASKLPTAYGWFLYVMKALSSERCFNMPIHCKPDVRTSSYFKIKIVQSQMQSRDALEFNSWIPSFVTTEIATLLLQFLLANNNVIDLAILSA